MQSIVPRQKARFGDIIDLSTDAKYELKLNFQGAKADDITVNLKGKLTFNIWIILHSYITYLG